MRKNVTAALLSGLILPGIGQIYRGRKLKGAVMVLLVTILLLVFFIFLASVMQECMQAARLHGNMDEALLAGILRRRLPVALWLGGGFFCIWLYGVVDALLDKDPGPPPMERETPTADGSGNP